MAETVSPISLFQALFLLNIVVKAAFFPGRGCGVFKPFKVLEKVPDGATKEDLMCTIVKDEACCSRQTVQLIWKCLWILFQESSKTFEATQPSIYFWNNELKTTLQLIPASQDGSTNPGQTAQYHVGEETWPRVGSVSWAVMGSLWVQTLAVVDLSPSWLTVTLTSVPLGPSGVPGIAQLTVANPPIPGTGLARTLQAVELKWVVHIWRAERNQQGVYNLWVSSFAGWFPLWACIWRKCCGQGGFLHWALPL